MKRTKALSLILCGAMALSLTGCMGGSKVSPNALYSYAKSDGAVVFDNIDEMKDAFEDDEVEDSIEDDGVALMLGVDELTEAMEDKDADLDTFNQFINDDMEEITIYMKKISSGNQLVAIAASFEDEDDAEDFYEKYESQFSSYAQLYGGVDSGEDGGIEYSTVALNEYGYTLGMGVYRDGCYTLIITQSASKGSIKELYDMCESMDLPMAETKNSDDDDDD